MIDKLKVNKVVLLDFQEPYSVGLADAVEAVLKKGGRLDDLASRLRTRRPTTRPT